MNIVQAFESPKIFGRSFKGESWKPWIVFLKILAGIPLTDAWEKDLAFRATGRREFRDGVGFLEAYAGVGRGSGKSRIALALAIFQALFAKDWKKRLAPGERGKILILATDREQAAVSWNYAHGLLHSNPLLEDFIQSETKTQISFRNRIDIEVGTSSFRAVRGRTIPCAILEELAFWRPDENSANPGKEIIRALRPGLMRIPGSLLIGISSVYAKEGVLYEKIQEHFGQDDSDVLTWVADSRMMNPLIDQKMIDREIAADPEAARAEWLSEFRSDISSFIGADLLDAAIVSGRTLDLSCPRTLQAFAFADPSGGRSDSFTLAISTIDESGKIRILALRETRPPFDPEEIVRDYADLMKRYGIIEVVSDRYAGEWTASAWRKFGISPKAMDLPASDLYLNLLPLLTAGRIELPDNPRMKSQFLNLERRVRPGGKDSISHPPGRAFHDDIANAIAGAAVLASRTIHHGAVFGMLDHDIHPGAGNPYVDDDSETPFGTFGGWIGKSKIR